MTIKIAISGAGYIANIHAMAVKNTPGANPEALVEAFPDKAESFAKKFGITRVYSTVDELLKDGKVDALVVGVPNALHAPQTIAALKAGVHVLVEKPMAMNAAEGEKMIAAGVKSGATLMVAHCWRFDSDVCWLKTQVDKGQLGKIIRTKGYGVHSNWGPSGWFTQKNLAGGGALADMGIHALDTARFLLGDPKPTSVYARIGTYYQDFDVDDTGVIIVNWDNGTTSYIESGWWQPHMDAPEAGTQLYGIGGFGSLFPTLLRITDLSKKTPRIKEVNPGFEFPRSEHCPQVMYDKQMAYFVKCIQKNQLPVPGGAEGLVNMKIVDAAYHSSATGKVVKI